MRISSIKPDVIALRELYKEEATSLQIPSIQRQFVWDSEDVKELIDSIVSGYPIGAVIIWEPTGRFPSAPLIGTNSSPGPPRYVLDGQQRLTALMLIQNGWQLARGDKKIQCTPISYVPENNKLYLSSKKGIDISLIVNASLGDADSLTKLQREYPAKYKQAMNSIGERIVNYKLPFYVLKSDSSGGEDVYENIAEIFTRVNSAGVKIGNLEMFLSFFAAAFPKKEKDRIIEIHEDLSSRFELDLEPLVRFVFSKMEMTQNQVTKVASFKKAIHDLKERYAKEKNRIAQILDKSQTAVNIVISVLDSEFGLSTTQYVPSQNVLLPLFDFAYEKGFKSLKDIPQPDKNKMLYWFLIASFNGIYSSSPNNKIEEDFQIIREGSKRFPLDKLLAAMKQRPPHRDGIDKADIVQNAYYNVLRGRTGKEYLMLLDILLFRNKATDWASKPVVSEQAAIHHIFPREFLKDNEETRDYMINSLANLTFISPSVNSEIGDESPDAYLAEYAKSDINMLEEHLIPTNRKLWSVDRFEDFLDARLNLIWKQTKELINTLE
jgi:hypothetical protein